MRMQRLFLMASVVIYVICLFPDSFCMSGDCDDWPGWGILMMGGFVVYASLANMTWLANPLLFLCWILLASSRWRAALVVGTVALGVAVSFLFQDEVLRSESGHLSRISGTAIGYWLWLASMAAACASAGYPLWLKARKTSLAAP